MLADNWLKMICRSVPIVASLGFDLLEHTQLTGGCKPGWKQTFGIVSLADVKYILEQQAKETKGKRRRKRPRKRGKRPRNKIC
ncbi:hypothetical protein QVD17_29051 [Tagetes erecta]|uniref:Uncharacterized protein n=1 Tax=Tagetes erecta TaxID=13708 RepID=A0AAD8NKW6_TARER|nr:hypothetical protein QVD17_29051 [Tagetes erecta]